MDLIAEQLQVVSETSSRTANQVGDALNNIEVSIDTHQKTFHTIEMEHRTDLGEIKLGVSQILLNSQEKAKEPLDRPALDDLGQRQGQKGPVSREEERMKTKGRKTKGKMGSKVDEISKSVWNDAEMQAHGIEEGFEDLEHVTTDSLAGTKGVLEALQKRSMPRSPILLLTILVLASLMVASTWLLQIGKKPLESGEANLQNPVASRTEEVLRPLESPSISVSFAAQKMDDVDAASVEMAHEATIDASGLVAATSQGANLLAAQQRNELDQRQKQDANANAMEEIATDIAEFLNYTGYSDVNAKDKQGRSLLHRAARLGRSRIVQALTQYPTFTNFNAKTSTGRTALHFAASAGSVESAEILLKEKRFTEVNSKDVDGWTALHHAVSKGHVEVLKAFLKSKRFTQLNARDKESTTVLHLAARWGRTEVVKALLKHPSFKQTNAKDSKGRTALHIAALDGHLEVAEELMHNKLFTEVNTKSNTNWTVLNYAVASGSIDTVKAVLLFNERFNAINARADGSGQTALHHAAFFGHLSIVELIMQDKSFTQLNAKDKKGCTALHVAAKMGFKDVVEVLMKAQNFHEANAKDVNGWTALHYAASDGRIHVAEVLLKSKHFAEVMAKDLGGQTARDIAEVRGHAAIADVIQHHLSETPDV